MCAPDHFDPAKIKFWSPLRRLKIVLADQSGRHVRFMAAAQAKL